VKEPGGRRLEELLTRSRKISRGRDSRECETLYLLLMAAVTDNHHVGCLKQYKLNIPYPN
jgi:hypothetical protein